MEKRRARTVIRSQNEVIRAQNVLIDWLLGKVDQERMKRLNGSHTPKEARNGHDREARD
jgi:hypothetical protein